MTADHSTDYGKSNTRPRKLIIAMQPLKRLKQTVGLFHGKTYTIVLNKEKLASIY
jgi:hypothetical protein